MATLPNNMPTKPTIVRCFEVYIVVDESEPKHPSVDQLENRIGDGPQWMEGVRNVTVRYSGSKEWNG